MESYIGKVNRFLFKSDTGYGIALFSPKDNPRTLITIKGYIDTMEVGVFYKIEGELVFDNKYKKNNLEVKTIQPIKEFDKNSLINYLSSPLFPTIGKTLATKIINTLGEDAFDIILKDNSKLLEVESITQAKAEIIIDVLEKNFKDNNILKVFTENSLKLEFYNILKNDIKDENEIVDILKNRFYEYSEKKFFTPFEEVDRVCLAFETQIDSEKRISWIAHHCLKQILFNTGHTYSIWTTLYKEIKNYFIKTNNQLNLTEQEIREKLLYAKEQEILFFKKIDEGQIIYTNESWNDEINIASRLTTINSLSNRIEFDKDINLIISQVEQEIADQLNIKNFEYNLEQKQAILNFVNNSVSIINGGPGTGKTTVINGIVKVWKKLYPTTDYAIVAPTGRAASRIKEASGFSTSTIHRLLRYIGNDQFEINEKNTISKDLVIIDESSMIDNHLFSNLLKGIKHIKRFVLVGDENQLPSVSYGNLYRDLIDCNQFIITKLIQNNRQSSAGDFNNGIINLANAILNDNELENFDFNNQNNLQVYFENDLEQLQNKIIDIYQKNNPIDKSKQLTDIQVIAPMYKEQLGVNFINSLIQKSINPNVKSTLSYKKGDEQFFINDKLIYLENDPSIELYNGDIGYILDIKKESEKIGYIQTEFNSKITKLDKNNLSKIKLSYACTIHKTQGSEYENVLLILDHNNRYSYFFNTKDMIYTAVTRAKKNLFIFSTKDLFIKSCKNPSKVRKTTLKQKILELINKTII